MNNLSKKLLILLAPILLAVQYSFAAPLPALFYASSFDVNVGETVSFDLKVNPSTAVYTVGATLNYDPVTLSFQDASVDKTWLPLSRAPYEVTDTASGKVVRTAGYPQGLTGVTPFTHYVFKAIAPGDTKVVISGGMALDADNNDAGLQNKVITIHVHGKNQPATEEPAETTKAPDKKLQPQTVTLNLTGSNAFYSDESYNLQVEHALKVAQDTTGTTSIVIYDQDGAEVYSSDMILNTATDTNLAFIIPADTINPGDYTIVATSKHKSKHKHVYINKS
jgi:hypothetical protein